MKASKITILFTLVVSLAIMLCVSTSAENERQVSFNKAVLIAQGYTSSRADELLEAYEKGEPLTPFHEAEYEQYNSPAEENGLGDDTLLLYGVIKGYVQDGDVIGFYLEQDDGNIWLVACGIKNGIGKDSTGKKNVFDDLEGEKIELYCKYMGFSEKYKLPTVDITGYGGALVLSDLKLIQTRTAVYNMQNTRPQIYNLGRLIGAKEHYESFERFGR